MIIFEKIDFSPIAKFMNKCETHNFDDFVVILQTALEHVYQNYSKCVDFQAGKQVCVIQYLSSCLTNISRSPLESDFIFRHEMQHFVNNLERYVVNQIIHVSWQEFQQALASKVHLIIIFMLIFDLSVGLTFFGKHFGK